MRSVNFNVVENNNSQLPAVLQRLQTELDKNPNLGNSRLICPRRLKPDAIHRIPDSGV